MGSVPHRGLFRTAVCIAAWAVSVHSGSIPASVQRHANTNPPGSREHRLQHLADAIPSRIDEMARFIAGMQGGGSDRMSALRETDDWKVFHARTDSQWIVLEDTLQKIRRWAQAEFPGQVNSEGDVFYPFSGPDFLYAATVYPNASRYVFFGLESPGFIPDPDGIPADSLRYFLSALDQSLSDLLGKRFFVTKEMIHDLRRENFKGTVPLLMYFMARSGYRVLSVQPVRIDTQGVVVYADAFSAKRIPNRGVEFLFRKNDSIRIQKLTYLTMDVSDEALGLNRNALRFLARLDSGVTTYIKAASYLMHRKGFDTIRETILARSASILQDDSSIPFKFLLPAEWKVTLYGDYIECIDSFRECNQPDLKAAYGSGARPLDFDLGYGRVTNLLLAVRKAPPAAKGARSPVPEASRGEDGTKLDNQ
jgi:hypothetical protein